MAGPARAAPARTVGSSPSDVSTTTGVFRNPAGSTSPGYGPSGTLTVLVSTPTATSAVTSADPSGNLWVRITVIPGRSTSRGYDARR